MCRKFKLKCAAVPVPARATIYNRTKRFGAADSILGSKRTRKRQRQTEGKLEKLLPDCTHLQEVNWLGLCRKRLSALSVRNVNPLNPELNPICYLLALLGAHHFLHVSRIRVKSLTFRLLMSYIYIYIYIWSTHS